MAKFTFDMLIRHLRGDVSLALLKKYSRGGVARERDLGVLAYR